MKNDQLEVQEDKSAQDLGITLIKVSADEVTMQMGDKQKTVPREHLEVAANFIQDRPLRLAYRSMVRAANKSCPRKINMNTLYYPTL